MSNAAQRTALVTGGSGGIGAAIAAQLAADGFAVAVHYRANRSKAQAVVNGIRDRGGRAQIFAADLLETELAACLVDAVVSTFDRLDLLVCNAGGYGRYDHFRDLEPAEWDAAMTLNAKAPLWLSRAVWPLMERQGGGRIIVLSSNSVKYPSPHAVHYRAAKAAAETIAVALAREGAPLGILVNTVRPGLIATGMQQTITGYTPERLAQRTALVPLGRAGVPDDVARMVSFLAGSGGDFVTGQTFTVSGGE